ncbi:MAG: hypothetical protein IT495_08035 [Gammaproteobacteria bacterium]|nr:hypothetical protein [Gammaproteobacteria bacterium]
MGQLAKHEPLDRERFLELTYLERAQLLEELVPRITNGEVWDYADVRWTLLPPSIRIAIETGRFLDS